MYGAAFLFKFVTRFICVETALAIMPRKKLASESNSKSIAAQIKKKSKKIH
jgi:hypothetical protein